jgi:hypothetical protein
VGASWEEYSWDIVGELCEGDLLDGEERARVRMKVRMRAIYHNVVMYTARGFWETALGVEG